MKTRKLEIEITEPMAAMLDKHVASGLYGANRGEAARRMLEAELRLKWPGGLKQPPPKVEPRY